MGEIEGKPVVVACYDTAVLEGTQSRTRNVMKVRKLIFLAVEHRWPFVCFAAGGGLQAGGERSELYGTAVGPHGVFDGLAELSGWAPTVAVIAGAAPGGVATRRWRCCAIWWWRRARFGVGGGGVGVGF